MHCVHWTTIISQSESVRATIFVGGSCSGNCLRYSRRSSSSSSSSALRSWPPALSDFPAVLASRSWRWLVGLHVEFHQFGHSPSVLHVSGLYSMTLVTSFTEPHLSGSMIPSSLLSKFSERHRGELLQPAAPMSYCLSARTLHLVRRRCG